MDHSPSGEADSSSASQEIPCNLMAHYRIHKSPLLVSMLRQIKPVHVPILFAEDPL
jgi:hypothetical protein